MGNPFAPTFSTVSYYSLTFLSQYNVPSFRGNPHCEAKQFVRHVSPTRRPGLLPAPPTIHMSYRLSRRTVLRFLSLVSIAPGHTISALAKDQIQTQCQNTQNDASSATSSESVRPISDIDPATNEPTITDRAYLDVSVGSMSTQRIIIGLYGDLLPNVVENFKKLAADGYANTSVYRIVPGLTIQLGDVLHNSGKSGRPALNEGIPFTPDNYRVSHTIPGIVSMVRTPSGCVDSRFFIATRDGDSLYLDGRYAAFGRVMEGMNVLKLVERAGGEGFIRRPVRIIASGLLK